MWPQNDAIKIVFSQIHCKHCTAKIRFQIIFFCDTYLMNEMSETGSREFAMHQLVFVSDTGMNVASSIRYSCIHGSSSDWISI